MCVCVYVCGYCEILIPLVECAIKNNHNDLTFDIIIADRLLRFIEMHARVPIGIKI